MPTIYVIFSSVSSFICLVSIILNALGVYLLFATRPLNNSKLLLVDLAASEIVNSVIQIVYGSLRSFSDKESVLILRKVSTTSWIVLYLAIFLLTIDRLIAIRYPLKYRACVTKKRLTRTMWAMWIFGLVLGGSFFVSNAWFVFFYYKAHLWVVFEVTLMIVCSTTYALIFVKIRSRRWVDNSNRFFKIASLIILSFIFFVLFPDVVYVFYPENARLVFESLCIVWFTRMMLDPVIYIFLQAELRSLLKSKLCRKNINQVSIYDETAF